MQVTGRFDELGDTRCDERKSGGPEEKSEVSEEYGERFGRLGTSVHLQRPHY